MRSLWKSLLTLSILAAPLFAGALRLEIGTAATNQEALAKHAVLVAWTTACHSPEKTTLTATAEGVANGMRKSIPLKLISLSAPGTLASAVVPIQNNAAELEAAKRYYHAPTETELSMSLN